MATESDKNPKVPATEANEVFKKAAELLDLNEQEADDFHRKCMERAGYKPKTHWSDPEPGPEDKGSRSGSGWFPHSE